MGRTTRALAGLVGVALTLSACGGVAATEPADAPPDRGEPTPPTTPGTATEVLLDGIAAMGAELYGLAARDSENNVVLSPVSITWAFAMARAGATGATAEQLDAVFGFPAGDALHAAVAELAAELDGAAGPEGVLEIVQAIWAEQGVAIGEDFVATLAEHYGAGLRTGDFAAADVVVDEINAWVAERTHDRIRRVFATLPPETVTALVNAMYLDVKWARPFGRMPTDDQDFHRLDGSTVTAPLMRNPELDTRVTQADDHVAVELAYEDADLAMVVVLPDEGSFDVVEQRFDGEFLTRTRAEMRRARVDLWLPRWDFQTDLDLLGSLARLGFDDCSGFAGIHPSVELGEAAHVANITVDEEGTQAAAATGLAFPTSLPDTGELEIRVDRPFLFAIVHTESGLPLFLGRVTDPTA